MTGAEYIIDALTAVGCSFFTFPGGCIAPLFDAIAKRTIPIFVGRHEQGAGYAALAKSRLLRRPQVMMVTSGPGVTNVMSVLADAFYDSTPFLLLTGQVGTGDLNSKRPVRQRGFQEVDTPALVQSISKACYQVRDVSELPAAVASALDVCQSGRPGPVVLDLPMDVQRAELSTTCSRPPIQVHHIEYTVIDKDVLGQVAKLLSGAVRPLIIAGQGVLLADATTLLRRMTDACTIPVVSTLLGLGVMDGESPLHLGFAGHTGLPWAGRAIQETDCLLVLGSRLDVRQTGTVVDDYARSATHIIHVDIDDNELLYPRVRTDIRIHANVRYFLESLLPMLDVNNSLLSKRKEWIASIKQDSISSVVEPTDALLPEELIVAVDKLTQDESIVVTTGVGSHQHWAARHMTFCSPRRTFLTSGGHGCMGYDLPSAIGAALSTDNHVLCFVGDASFQMNIQELQSIREYNLPIKIFVLDNKRMALVSQFQKLNWHSDPTTGGIFNPDYVSIARAYGIDAMQIIAKSDLSNSIFSQKLRNEDPVLFHCTISTQADIRPMLLAGDKLDAMSTLCKEKER